MLPQHHMSINLPPSARLEARRHHRTRFYNCYPAGKKTANNLINIKIKFGTVTKRLFTVVRRDWTKWPTVSPFSLQAHSCSAQYMKLHTWPQTFHYFTDNYCYLIPEYLDGLDSAGTNWKFFVPPNSLSISLVRSLLRISKNFSFKLKETGEDLLTCTSFLKISKNSLKSVLCPPIFSMEVYLITSNMWENPSSL